MVSGVTGPRVAVQAPDDMLESRDLVSVVIPTYNRCSKVLEAIESACNQTYSNIEVIVVDDASTDDTEHAIATLNDDRIQYVKHRSNHGVSAARNTGIRLSHGKYIAFLDSDDLWRSSKLERQVNLFETTELKNVGVVTCGARELHLDGQRVWLPSHRGNVVSLLLRQKRIGIGPPFLLIKKKYLDSLDHLFDENLLAREEWDLAIRLFQICQMDYVDEPLLIIRHHRGERVWTPERAIQASEYMLEKHSDLFQGDPVSFSLAVLALCRTYIAANELGSARQAILRAWKIRPGIIESLWIIYALILFGEKVNWLHRLGLRILNIITFKR